MAAVKSGPTRTSLQMITKLQLLCVLVCILVANVLSSEIFTLGALKSEYQATSERCEGSPSAYALPPHMYHALMHEAKWHGGYLRSKRNVRVFTHADLSPFKISTNVIDDLHAWYFAFNMTAFDAGSWPLPGMLRMQPGELFHMLATDVPCAYGCCDLPFSLRWGTTDLYSVKMTLLDNEYLFLKYFKNLNPRHILSAGGIGFGAIWAAMLYPNATVHRIDAHPENFRLGVYNAINFNNVRQYNIGLWPKIRQLKICDPHTGAWGMRITATDATKGESVCTDKAVSVPAMPLTAFMEMHSIPGFEIMEVDIEGSEAHLFAGGDQNMIMEQTKVFAIELHDSLVANCTQSVDGMFTRLNKKFKDFKFNENRIWIDASLCVV